MKIAMVTTLMPETHYSRYLLESLHKKYKNNFTLYVYANKEDKIVSFDNIKINQCWSKNVLYPLQIMKQTIKDKVDIVHLQHEINMYGGPITAVIFPLHVLLLRLSGRKVIVTIHAVVPKKDIDLDFLETFSWPKNKLLVEIARIVLSYIYTTTSWFSNTLIVHSEHIKSVLISDYMAKRDKVFVIPHGVPIQEDNSNLNQINANWWRKIENRKIILCFGYVVRRKGIEYLIEAFEKISETYPNYVLVLAGGTLKGQEDYVENLKEMVKEKELSDKIVFTSFIKESELRGLFRLSEFVVMPAIYSISASGPLAQAISYNKPIVGTNLGTLAEEIDDGIDGILCKPKDAKSLKEAIEKLIKTPNLIKNMSNNIKEKVKERSWSNVSEKTYGIYYMN